MRTRCLDCRGWATRNGRCEEHHRAYEAGRTVQSHLLHTRVYAELCDRIGGFVHHYPERPDPTRHDADAPGRTVALIEEAGYTPDRELWTGPTRALVAVAANCSHTPVPGGCGPINPGACASHCNGGGGGGGGGGEGS